MFGQEYGTVIDINPFYIECTTPRYPTVQTVPIWIYHGETFTTSDKTYDFTNEQMQAELEVLVRNLFPSGSEGVDTASLMSLMGRLGTLPSSTDISSQTESNGTTMLHNTVLLSYQKGVDLLIEEGIELDIEDDSGLTALDYAIFINNVEITEALLMAGSMPSYERLANLHLSPTADMLALLKTLCNVDLPVNPAPQGPLLDAAATAEVYDEGSSDPIEENIVFDTASETLDVEDSQMSPPPLSSSAPVLERTRVLPLKNPRPLSIATVATQSTGMVSLAPTMSTTAHSATSSTLSRQSIPLMGGRPANQGAKGLENIWQCAKKGNLALVKYHLEKDPNLISTPWKFDGRSALISACASSKPQELVEFLVQRGAQVNSADTFHKRTALHTLCEEGGLSQDDWRIVMSQADQDANEQDVLLAMRFLLDYGADVDAKNHWKETALMRLLAGRDCPLMVQELYSRGADSRLKSSKDRYPHGTALCYAAFYGRIKSLKWMIENDLLLNDDANIKEAIRWAKQSKGEYSHGGTQPSAARGADVVRKKEERKADAIRLLESWLGEAGLAKRKALAKDVTVQSSEDWWRRMSGIMDDVQSKAADTNTDDIPVKEVLDANNNNNSKMPMEMMPLWQEVQALSEGLSQADTVSSPGNRIKWNPLTILRK
ncbi:hypothetical protein BGZ65_008629 [Modicella reniformis]|uniref:Ankyrin n=1 Tax=Modicella reniformis TaxID=1440133 RepID=A0A9P6SV24_9FUNG|nr:hypothetical protein BGZ65_008629 [Modicella reniformis]